MTDQTILIIRHGEKPVGKSKGVNAEGKSDSHSLTTTGWARAGALPGLFLSGKLPRPDRVYASQGDTKSRRPAQTVVFVAAMFGLTSNVTFDVESRVPAFAAELLKQAGVTLVSMEHTSIVALLRALGAPGPVSWPDARFDVCLRLTRAQGVWTATQVPQMLLPGDRSTGI